jgi:hypothetical protein
MLPYLQAYNDPRIEKAYRRYLAGGSQRVVAAALKIPQRTLARYCKNDGWETERKARGVTEEAPTVAAVAAEASPAAAKVAAPAANPESRVVGMERILGRQQRITGRLIDAYERDVEKTLADASAPGKSLSRSQIAQLSILGNNLMAMERKAWCVPDKIETKDTTPTAADRNRNLKDDELQRRIEENRVARVEAERRRGAAAAGRGSPAASVN